MGTPKTHLRRADKHPRATGRPNMKTKLRAAYVIGFRDGDHAIWRDAEVVLAGSDIEFVGRDYPGAVERTFDFGSAIISPGFIDLDALADIDHVLLDSWHGKDTASGLEWSEDYFLNRRHDVFSSEAIAFKREYALVQLIRNGITTAMPIAAETHNAWAETYDDLAAMADIAGKLGMRMYLGPAYRSGVNVTRMDGTRDVLWKPELGEQGLTDAIRFFRDIDGTHNGLLRGCLLPCRIETVTKDLMRATARAAEDLDCLVRIHALQGAVELELLRKWYGQAPLDVLDEVGLLGPRLLSPHGLMIGGYPLNELPYHGEVERMAASGMTVVHCPLNSFRHGRILQSFDRYRQAGVNIALGTDSFPPDMIRGMDTGTHAAQWVDHRSDAGAASDYFRAATLGGAAALKRTDLGRLAPGAKADIAVIDLHDLGVGAVDDVVRTLLMNCTGADVRTVFIDGRIVMSDRQIPGVDYEQMRKRAQSYFETMKAAYSERDYLGREPDKLFPPSFPQIA